MDVLSTKISDAGGSVRLAERVSGKASECRRRRRNTYRPRKVRRRRIHLVQMKMFGIDVFQAKARCP